MVEVDYKQSDRGDENVLSLLWDTLGWRGVRLPVAQARSDRMNKKGADRTQRPERQQEATE
jgi:hypothetical protein